jgi:hypothetical protein
MRFPPFIAAVLLAVADAPCAAAQHLTAGDLHGWCDSDDLHLRNLCRFYILGAFEGFDFGSSATQAGVGKFVPKANPDICIPRDIQQSQMVALFQEAAGRLARTYPDDLKAPAMSVLAAAISRAFPCRRRKAPENRPG